MIILYEVIKSKLVDCPGYYNIIIQIYFFGYTGSFRLPVRNVAAYERRSLGASGRQFLLPHIYK